jgi:hypothetical protein
MAIPTVAITMSQVALTLVLAMENAHGALVGSAPLIPNVTVARAVHGLHAILGVLGVEVEEGWGKVNRLCVERAYVWACHG